MKKPNSRARRKGGKHPAALEATPDLSPLDFVLRIMRDETQPPALRASMAKAAMPYLHRRFGDEAAPEDEPDEQPLKSPPKSPTMSDLELARRIADILTRADQQIGNPVEKPVNADQEGTQDGALGAKTS